MYGLMNWTNQNQQITIYMGEGAVQRPGRSCAAGRALISPSCLACFALNLRPLLSLSPSSFLHAPLVLRCPVSLRLLPPNYSLRALTRPPRQRHSLLLKLDNSCPCNPSLASIGAFSWTTPLTSKPNNKATLLFPCPFCPAFPLL